MRLELGELVQWTEDGKHHTGRRVIYGLDGVLVDDFYDRYLVKHSYTGELHAVFSGDLSPYPSSPIPEPTK